MMRACDQRGFTLIAVLIAVSIALLIGTSMLFLSQAEAASRAGVGDAAQTRALAWSGIQAVMSELDRQRDAILDGEIPQLADELTIYELDDRIGVVRVLPLGFDGSALVSEAGKLDLNTVGAEELIDTGLVDPDVADAIIAYRDGERAGTFHSVAELLRVEGVTPTMLYGPLDDIRPMDAALEPEEVIVGDMPRGLADVVTVYGFEPSLQRNGRLRINLNTEWSEELGDRVEERFGRGARDVLRGLFEQGATFETDGEIIQQLIFFDMPPEEWVEIVDVFTTDDAEFRFGRLDINTAPYEALMALPELTPEQAAAMVQTRDGLTHDERASIVWPVIAGVVEPDAYAPMAEHVTTRSWTYRLQLAAGEVDLDEPDGPLLNPVIHEVVIDLSAPRARVAYLRDVTMLQMTALLAIASKPDGTERGPSARGMSSIPRQPTTPGAVGDDVGADGIPDAVGDPLDLNNEEFALDEGLGDLGDEGASAAFDQDDPEDEAFDAPGTPPASTETRRRIGRWTPG